MRRGAEEINGAAVARQDPIGRQACRLGFRRHPEHRRQSAQGHGTRYSRFLSTKPDQEHFPGGNAGTAEIPHPVLQPRKQRTGNSGTSVFLPDRPGGNIRRWRKRLQRSGHRTGHPGFVTRGDKFRDWAAPYRDCRIFSRNTLAVFGHGHCTGTSSLWPRLSSGDDVCPIARIGSLVGESSHHFSTSK